MMKRGRLVVHEHVNTIVRFVILTQYFELYLLLKGLLNPRVELGLTPE